MKTFDISVRVNTESDMAGVDVARVVERLIDQGIDGAGKQLKDALAAPYPPETGDIQLASELFISGVEVAPKPRVLITVSGGVAEYVCDDGVDVEVFDWDNYKVDPVETGPVQAHFEDLATPQGIPVEESRPAPKLGM
jgi:hypothetical protein